MTNPAPLYLSIEKAHADGRHASTHPEDRAFWVKAGCPDCTLLERAAEVARTVATEPRRCTCGAVYFTGCFCNTNPAEFLASGGNRRLA